MKQAFLQARFIASALGNVPPWRSEQGKPLPEVAFIGRSNVGKSSLINHLCRKKGLAHVSAKPGKTDTLNFFNVSDLLILVDLPGYGFAKRSKEVRDGWAQAIDGYLHERATLKLLLLLIDARRPPSEEDLALIEWAAHFKKNLLIVRTKSDTLKGKKPLVNSAIVGKEGVDYSIHDPQAREILIEKIAQALYSSQHGVT